MANILGMIPGNKLKEYGDTLQNTGNKLKKKESDLKILGEEMIFMENFRKNEIRIADFLEYLTNIVTLLSQSKALTIKAFSIYDIFYME